MITRSYAHTLEETAAHLNLTTEQVMAAEKTALRKLRNSSLFRELAGDLHGMLHGVDRHDLGAVSLVAEPPPVTDFATERIRI